jgi:hypothetical protein
MLLWLCTEYACIVVLLRYSDEICQINHNLSPDWSNPQVRFAYYYLGYLTLQYMPT